MSTVTADDVYGALREVKDPEIPMDVVELGLIYDVRVNDHRVEIDMTLTSMGCPCGDLIVDDVREAVVGLSGVDDAEINLVWDPPWDRSRLGERGLKYLPIIGIGA